MAQAVEAFRQGQMAESEALCREALTHDPKLVKGWRMMAMLADRVGKLELALKLLTNAHLLDPQNPDTLLDLGRLLRKQQRNQEARRILNRALALAPDNPYILFENALTTQSLAQPEAAITMLKRVLAIQPQWAEALNNLANLLLHQKCYSEAIACYQQALRLHPESPEVLYNLAGAYHADQQHEEAILLLERITSLRPDWHQPHRKLGLIHADLKQIDRAETHLKKAVALHGEDIDALAALGLLYRERRALEKARGIFRRLVELRPENVGILNMAAVVLREMGHHQEGLALIGKALQIDPNATESCNNLGLAHMELKHTEQAIHWFRRLLQLDPNSVAGLSNLGLTLQERGQLEEALALHMKAATLEKHNHKIFYNIASVRSDLGQVDEAIEALEQAVKIDPSYEPAWTNMGNQLKIRGNMEAAKRAYLKALELENEPFKVLNNLGNLYMQMGQFKASIPYFRRALALDPTHNAIHSNLIFALDHNPDAPLEELISERRNWQKQHAAPLNPTPAQAFANDPDQDRILRIGYVSADFRGHSAASTFGANILHYDRQQFEVFCYSNNAIVDPMTLRLKEAATDWRQIHKLDDEKLHKLILRDRIDILVDLSGHSKGNRLPLFARRAAPIQVTGWGYNTGTGLKSIDYGFNDPVTLPASQRHGFSEEIIDLPYQLHFQPIITFPEIHPLPAYQNGYITFGSFNRSEKYNPEILSLWAEVLKAVPKSRLLLKLHKKNLDDLALWLRQQIENSGIDPARLQILGWTPQPEHLRAFNLLDIALDPFPHGGGITSMEAMRMGIPVITRLSDYIASRGTAACWKVLGDPSWIAESKEKYIEIACQKSADLEGLAELRSTLRERFDASPLGNHQLYVSEVERAYRWMWKRWLSKRSA